MNTLTTIKKPLIGSMKLSIMFIMIGLLASTLNVKAQQGLYDYNDFTPYEKSRCDLATEAMEKIVKVMESLSPYDQMTLGLTYAKAIENSDNEYKKLIEDFEAKTRQKKRDWAIQYQNVDLRRSTVIY